MKVSQMLAIALFSFVIISCKNAEKKPDEHTAQTSEWMVGEEADVVEKKLNMGKGSVLQLEFEMEGLCPNSGIEVQVETSGQKIKQDLLTTWPAGLQIEIPKEGEVTLTTKVVTVSQQPVCMRLGNIFVRATY